MDSAAIRNLDITSNESRNSLKLLQDALQSAEIKHTEDNGNVHYLDKSLDNKVLSLLKCLELTGLGYTAWKVVTRLPIRNKIGPEYIIPILSIPGTEPKLVPRDRLHPETHIYHDKAVDIHLGSYLYHDGPVDLLPGLTCLFVGIPS
ncbi:uncharacterized protein TRUGW13939_10495 [Talaromyces rugulosus]|uniref:Uncharacterized protein n=1 Tax=Talaromyces rugulosus TaxID=121627 RepID=A0A7H8RCT9_TALRU|nr:uncharacterized protein TRUGW13939_10495 [Talaromyces rugulosus]QKX63325.1 hypothetical protein TRUGW13939_10495 [Talaromyces rugulosus]